MTGTFWFLVLNWNECRSHYEFIFCSEFLDLFDFPEAVTWYFLVTYFVQLLRLCNICAFCVVLYIILFFCPCHQFSIF